MFAETGDADTEMVLRGENKIHPKDNNFNLLRNALRTAKRLEYPFSASFRAFQPMSMQLAVHCGQLRSEALPDYQQQLRRALHLS